MRRRLRTLQRGMGHGVGGNVLQNMDCSARRLGRKFSLSHTSRDHGSKARRIRVGLSPARDKRNPHAHFSAEHSDQGRIRCRFRVHLSPRGRERGTEIRRRRRRDENQHLGGRLCRNQNRHQQHHRATHGDECGTRGTYVGNDRARSCGHGYQRTRPST